LLILTYIVHLNLDAALAAPCYSPRKKYLHYLERDYFENGQEEFEMGLPNIEGGTGNSFSGWMGFFPPSSCMPFPPKVISVTRCASHGAASDAIFRAARISLIAVFNPKSD